MCDYIQVVCNTSLRTGTRNLKHRFYTIHKKSVIEKTKFWECLKDVINFYFYQLFLIDCFIHDKFMFKTIKQLLNQEGIEIITSVLQVLKLMTLNPPQKFS